MASFDSKSYDTTYYWYGIVEFNVPLDTIGLPL